MPSHTSNSFLNESYSLRLSRRNPYICRCFWDTAIFHSFISESFSQPPTWNWSWQSEEPVPGVLYSIMLSLGARKEPEVRRRGTWRDFTLTFERWKEWLGISEGLAAPPSVFQTGDGFSLKERAEMSGERLDCRGFDAWSLCDRQYSLPRCASYSTI